MYSMGRYLGAVKGLGLLHRMEAVEWAQRHLAIGIQLSDAQRHYSSGTDGTATGIQGRTATAGGAPSNAIGSARADMAMVFTCSRCDTRAVKAFSRSSYEKGLVLVRCPGCNALHLVADHLGWFGDKGWTVEQLAAERGTRVTRVTPSSTDAAHSSTPHQLGTSQQQPSLSAEDLAGWSKVEALMDLMQGEGRTGSGSTRAGSSSGPADGAQDRQRVTAAAWGDTGVLAVTGEDVELWRKVEHCGSGSTTKGP